MIEFSTVFGESGNNNIDRLVISDIVVSKSTGSIKVVLASELTDVMKVLAMEQIKKTVGNAKIDLHTDFRYLLYPPRNSFWTFIRLRNAMDILKKRKPPSGVLSFLD